MFLQVLFATTCIAVLVATIPTQILLSYVNNKPLGLQILMDITTKTLFYTELAYMYAFWITLAAILFVDQSGVPLKSHGHFLDDIDEDTIAFLTRFVPIYILCLAERIPGLT